MKNFENILLELKDNIAVVSINRPSKLNALNKATMKDLDEAFDLIYENNDIKAVVITGVGEKAFAAGADISEFLDLSAEEGKNFAQNGHRVFNKIEQCPKPVLAAVNGFALGGGCELAMACHIRLCSTNAVFGQPEVNLGLIPGYGGTQRLVQYIGKSKAFELLMTAEMIKAEEALNLGLVNYVVEKEELLDKAIEITKKILQKAPIAISSIIKSVNAYYSQTQDGFATEIQEFGNCVNTFDFKEGAKAFLEKRQAKFIGK